MVHRDCACQCRGYRSRFTLGGLAIATNSHPYDGNFSESFPYLLATLCLIN